MTWSVFSQPYFRIALVVAVLAGVVVATSLTAQPAVIIYPGDNIQNAVNANPPGTVFVIKAGTHRGQTVWPKDNMTFVGETGAVLDGEYVAERAFGQPTLTEGRNVTVRNLRITRYAPPNTGAVVEGHESSGWIVEGNEIDNNRHRDVVNGVKPAGHPETRVHGVRVGSNWTLRYNRVHHNGWVGISGYQCSNTRIEGNDVYDNPDTVFEDDVIHEASNIKVFECDGLVVRGNWVHDGPEEGIWLDTSRVPSDPTSVMTVENNWVVNHGDKGIWYENSLTGVIRGNYVENAGYREDYSPDWMTGGGIQITNSPNVTVIDNVIRKSLNGIVGQHAISYSSGRELRNLLVESNSVDDMVNGETGIVANGGDPFSTLWNNRFVKNRYVLPGNATPFRWGGTIMTWSQWQGIPNDEFGWFAD